jgi:hypothetical protein
MSGEYQPTFSEENIASTSRIEERKNDEKKTTA